MGAELRRTLREKGHDVYGIDVSGGGDGFRSVDLTDAPSLIECVDEISPDCIFHLAAVSRVDFNDPSKIYEVNVAGTVNLLSASLRLPRLPRVLVISSSQVYGIVDPEFQPINEKQPINPVNHYGASKAACEHISLAFYRDQGLPVTVARPFNHIGRGQDPHFFVPKIVEAAREKKLAIEVGDTSVIRDFLDVRDVVEAYIMMMEQFPEGKSFNIAGGIGYRLSDIVNLIQELSGITFRITRADTLMRKNEITTTIGDSSALTHCIGWSPSHSIRDTLEWMLSE